MKRMIATTGALLTASTAMAAGSGAEGSGMSFMTVLFMGFGALVICFQTVPAIMLIAGMLKGIFSPAAKDATTSN